MPFTLPPLPYAFDALTPHIDAKTMEIHHDRHHKAYVDNANKALEGTKFADMDPVEVIRHLNDIPDDKRGAVRNNAGGHVNHSMFWTLMAPAGKGGGGQPTGEVAKAINAAFGTFDHFKEEFAKAAMGRFGSGWAWLCVKADGSGVQICSTPNQDSPFMGKAIAGCDGKPILGIDVWEHAYYLNYQNKRADYITAWWNVVNWEQVAKNYAAK
jgi:superoxide dismutase, Fe-Mn family